MLGKCYILSTFTPFNYVCIIFLKRFFINRYVPESMRWLQTQNRIEEMSKILSKVAKSNGKTLPPSVKEALLANPIINNNASKMVITNYAF